MGDRGSILPHPIGRSDRQALRELLLALQRGEVRVAGVPQEFWWDSWTFVPAPHDPDAGTLQALKNGQPVGPEYPNPRLVVSPPPTTSAGIAKPPARERPKTDLAKAIETVWDRDGDPAGRRRGVYDFQQKAEKELARIAGDDKATIGRATVNRHLRRLREKQAQQAQSAHEPD